MSHRLPLAKYLRANGWAVTLITDCAPSADRLTAEGFAVHKTGFQRKSPGLAREAVNLLHIGKIIRKVRPDVVHNIALKSAVFGSLAARWFSRAKIVNSITGLGITFALKPDEFLLKRFAMEILMRVALSPKRCRTIVQNPDDLEFLAAKNIIRRENTHLIYGSGVDAAEYAIDENRNSTDETRVVLAARLLWSKGVAEFVEAADLLASGYPRVRFLIAGRVDDANPDHIPQATLEDWSRKPNVAWIGYIDEMIDFLSDAAIVVLPSYREGVPRVLIEAAMLGKPIVTTDVPGCREAVVHGKTGLLVPPRDGRALADAIRSLLDDAGKRLEYGLAGRAVAKERFSLEQVLRETGQVYREALTS